MRCTRFLLHSFAFSSLLLTTLAYGSDTIDFDINPSHSAAASFDWQTFIAKHKPKTLKFIGVYLGGASASAQINSKTVRFRPASTEKLFTASAYLENRVWDPEITHFLKMSVNQIGDGVLAPRLGNGSYAQGLKVIESYANSVVQEAMQEQDIPSTRVSAYEDYSGKLITIDPYFISCKSGSGIDGESTQIKKHTPHSAVTVAALRLFLEELKSKPYFEHILSSLPIAGVDGTLYHRMRSGAATGAVAAKTGTLNGVKNLAGYIHILDQGRSDVIPFVILTQSTTDSTTQASDFQDLLVNQMASLLNAVPFEATPGEFGDDPDEL